MNFRPCIDLHNGKVKQIIGSTLSEQQDSVETNFESEKSSEWYAELYKNDELYGGHVIMLGSGNEIAAKKALSAFENGLQVGGGITTANAIEYLEAGASHVIITSFVFKNGIINWDNLKKIKETIGKSRLVLDLSCSFINNNYYIMTDRWQNATKTSINKNNIETLEEYCSEFLIHAVDVEGKMEGIDKRLIKLLAEIITIPVTYAGGISDFEDLKIIRNIGQNKIDFTIGSALDIFGGHLSYKKVIGRYDRLHNPDKPFLRGVKPLY